MYPKRRWRNYYASAASHTIAAATASASRAAASAQSDSAVSADAFASRGPPKKPRACALALPIAKKPRLSARFPLDSLPHDIIPHIVDFLPLEDIQAIRLIGLGSASPALHAHLSHVMRAHIREVQHLWNKMDTNDLADMFDGIVPGFELRESGNVLRALQARCNVYASPCEPESVASPSQQQPLATGAPAALPDAPASPHSSAISSSSAMSAAAHSTSPHPPGIPPPTQITPTPPHKRSWPLPPVSFSRLDFLSTHGLDGRMLGAILRNMPRLRRLHVSRKLRMNPPRVLLHPARVLRTIPAELGRCMQLTELAIMNHRIDAVPEAVLRLRNLRKLVIDQSDRVTELPRDIGARLPRLRSFSAEWCKLYTVPQSLLQTLERNFVDGDERTHDYGLFVTDIPKDYLRALIPRDEYPHLHAQVSKRQKW